MTRTARTRTRSKILTGTWTINGSPSTWTRTRSHVCADWHGRPVADNPLTITNTRGDGLRLNGACESTFNGARYTFNNLPINPSTTLNTTPLAAPSGWYLTLVARTNPSRPVMTPPELIQDLIDVPKQLRELGNLITAPVKSLNAKGIANHYLGLEFGWKPLIEDVNQLLDLQSYADKRMQEIQRLYSGRGLHRRIRFGEDHANEAGKYRLYLVGPNNYIDCLYDCTVIKKSWGSIRWKPTSPPPYDPRGPEMNRLCRRIVSGWTLEGLSRGAWQVLPWTWLLGWFTNVGLYTLANSNTIPASHSGGCFMSSCERVYSASGPSTRGTIGSVEFSGGEVFSTKTRVPSGSLTPGFSVPFLDTWRLSILSALFTQRAVR